MVAVASALLTRAARPALPADHAAPGRQAVPAPGPADRAGDAGPAQVRSRAAVAAEVMFHRNQAGGLASPGPPAERREMSGEAGGGHRYPDSAEEEDEMFGGHEFAYESATDLFRCTRCRAYEVTTRADGT